MGRVYQRRAAYKTMSEWRKQRRKGRRSGQAHLPPLRKTSWTARTLELEVEVLTKEVSNESCVRGGWSRIDRLLKEVLPESKETRKQGQLVLSLPSEIELTSFLPSSSTATARTIHDSSPQLCYPATG